MRNLSLFAFIALTGCGSSTQGGGTGEDMTHVPMDLSAVCGGGPITGAADMHCVADSGIASVAVDSTQCMASGGATTTTYGATMYGTSGYDDGCKYLVSYNVSPICETRGTTFTVTLKSAVDGSLVSGADPTAEITLDETHKAPAIGSVTSELTPGVYSIGPVDFDGEGNWVVRFHFFNDCVDLPTSPRGQAAFFIHVD